MRNFVFLAFLLSAVLHAAQASRKLGESSAAREERQLLSNSTASGSSAHLHKKKHMHPPNRKHPLSGSTSFSATPGAIFATGTEADFEHITGTVVSTFNVEPISNDPLTDIDLAAREVGNRRNLLDTPDVTYHGGPVMSSGAYLYLIFVSGYSKSNNQYTGDGWSSSTITAVENFFSGIDTTSVFQHLKAYGVKPFAKIIGTVSLTLNTDNTVMTSAWSQAFVKYVLQAGLVSPDYAPNTIFHVLTDSGLVPWNETEMCVDACGWHTGLVYNNVEYIYSWIPQPQACAQRGVTCYTDSYPVNDVYTQALISIVYHETVEAMTDFNGNAWYDQDGDEIMDLCAWQYGAVSTYQNSSCGCQQSYNTKVGSNYYLIQGMYVINGAKQIGCKWT